MIQVCVADQQMAKGPSREEQRRLGAAKCPGGIAGLLNGDVHPGPWMDTRASRGVFGGRSQGFQRSEEPCLHPHLGCLCQEALE